MIKLSQRLKALADFIEDNTSVIDIGCDHGLLDIYIMQTKKNVSIIASDVNEFALNNAKANIKKYKLDNCIKTILSNGLDNIDTKSSDTIVIAGMGSHTAVGILYNNLKKLKNIKRIIIQCNNDLDFLRSKVTKIGFYIKSEKMVKDAGKIYTIIEFSKGFRIYTKKQLYFGPYLLKYKDSLFREKCLIELNKLKSIYPLITIKHLSYKLKVYFKIKMLKKILSK